MVDESVPMVHTSVPDFHHRPETGHAQVTLVSNVCYVYAKTWVERQLGVRCPGRRGRLCRRVHVLVLEERRSRRGHVRGWD